MNSVLIVAFDGLQPAQVTAELLPNLAGWAEGGVSFNNSHAVFPTVTRVNASSIVTGRYPGGHGIAGNVLVVREFDPYRAIQALEPVLTRMAEVTTVQLAPTLGDILGRHGLEFIAVGTGTSGNAYLQNPNAEQSGGATIHPDFCLPRRLHSEVTARFGGWPPSGETNAAKLQRAVDVMTEYVLPERGPAVSLVWFSEPDHAQHAKGVGAPEALRAIREADFQFGRLLRWLEERGQSGNTNVMVVSDHGYSTVTGVVEIEPLLREAGFPPGDQPGGVIVAPNGGSALFYIHRHGVDTNDPHPSSQAAASRLAEWLMTQPWCGALVASDAAGKIPGTLPARLVGLEGQRTPDLAMSFRWDSRPNTAGYRGHVYSTYLAPGQGQHGSMSRHETRNVLFAGGPDFKAGVTVASPVGVVDIAPTVLRLLGIAAPGPMDGRILFEAMSGGPHAVEWQTVTHQAERAVPGDRYRQEITLSTVGDTIYVDEGTGGVETAST